MLLENGGGGWFLLWIASLSTPFTSALHWWMTALLHPKLPALWTTPQVVVLAGVCLCVAVRDDELCASPDSCVNPVLRWLTVIDGDDRQTPASLPTCLNESV